MNFLIFVCDIDIGDVKMFHREQNHDKPLTRIVYQSMVFIKLQSMFSVYISIALMENKMWNDLNVQSTE